MCNVVISLKGLISRVVITTSKKNWIKLCIFYCRYLFGLLYESKHRKY